MSYEREAIAPNNLAAPNLPQQNMREDRVFEPYKIQGPTKNIATPDSGQVANNKSGEEETSPKHVESVSLSPAAAALARKEQKFRQQEQQFKAQQAALEAERAEIAELKALKAKLAAKDFSGIEQQVPYEDYVNYLMNKGKDSTPEQEAVAKLTSEIENLKKAQQDDVSKRFDAAVAERKKAVLSLVESKPEEFATIKELKMEEAVVQHILDSWEHDNLDLDPEQAAKEVEEILLEKGQKWAALTKLKAKTPLSDEKKELPPLKPSVKTLTNNMAPIGEIARPKRSYEGMSDSERYAEARRRAEEKIKTGQV